MVDATDSKSVESNLMWVQVPPPAPTTFLFELFKTEARYFSKSISLKKLVDFFYSKILDQLKKSPSLERRFFMIQIIKEKLEIEPTLKQRLEFICEFAKVKPKFINGNIRKIDKTNLFLYIEPHKLVIKKKEFLFFNYSNIIYIFTLARKINISELEKLYKKSSIK